MSIIEKASSRIKVGKARGSLKAGAGQGDEMSPGSEIEPHQPADGIQSGRSPEHRHTPPMSVVDPDLKLLDMEEFLLSPEGGRSRTAV